MVTFLKCVLTVLCTTKNTKIIRNIFISLSRKGNTLGEWKWASEKEDEGGKRGRI